ncbi:hypothetical protein [Corallococcus exiguus]|uniref:Uncharacterized protein n=1 Tax=Corallococcus exiguus TaxID=83462 RepID=A0A7X4YIZ0_9BACT|nr:hypothetical protein [Corallococcus exiguus]NBC46248.1 hypothetical protein [Corallococcus exiguus]TNV61277.1 hypothetical protein FH620_21765 [Corallococcus exiguus]
MNLQRVVVTTRATQELAGLPENLRLYVEGYLENLDALLDTAPLHRISMLWERAPNGAGFLTNVEGAFVAFSVDELTGGVIVTRIEPHDCTAGR